MNPNSFVSTVLTVLGKEWRDFYRDRRTFFLSLLVAPLLYPLIFLGIGKLTQMRTETQLDKPISLPVVGIEQAPNLVKMLTGAMASQPRSTSSPTPPAAMPMSPWPASARCWRTTAMASARYAC